MLTGEKPHREVVFVGCLFFFFLSDSKTVKVDVGVDVEVEGGTLRHRS